MSAPALAFEGVSKRYGQGPQALDDVSLEVPAGSVTGLLGPNGAGTTTLISILAGLARPSAGRARVLGVDVQRQPLKARRLLGVVPQELSSDPFFTVREALRLQSGYFGLRRNDAWIDELLHHLGLADKADSLPRQLSGGMKRRLMVAQALVHRPPVIVLDEPTAGVDVDLRQSLWQFITRLNREGHTILLTTHYLEEAQALADRIAMLRRGRLVALAGTAELLAAASGGALVFSVAADTANWPESLPAALRPAARVTGHSVQLPVQGALDVEQALAALRLAGLAVENVQVRRADLEDVFLRVMADAADGADAAPAERAAS